MTGAWASGNERAVYILLRGASAIVPNFQVLWLSDSLTQDHRIPPAYVAQTAGYGLLYIIAALSLATMMFQRREVG